MKLALATAVAAALLVIGSAEADDESAKLSIPDHWRELPEMNRMEAVDGSVSVVSRAAWGDPVGGVFFVQQTLETTRKGKAGKVSPALLETLGAADLEVGQVEATDSTIELKLAASGFQGAMVAGISKLDKGKLRVRSAACFYNQREPDISEQLCKGLLSQFSASL